MQMVEYRSGPPKTSEEEDTCVARAIRKLKKPEEKVVSHVSATVILGPKCISKVADRSKRQGRKQ